MRDSPNRSILKPDVILFKCHYNYIKSKTNTNQTILADSKHFNDYIGILYTRIVFMCGSMARFIVPLEFWITSMYIYRGYPEITLVQFW